MKHINTIKTKNIASISIMTSAISLVLLSASTQSLAKTIALEKCAGIVKAGLNDCGSTEHICAGLNTDDGNSEDWIWLPEGTCTKISGAELISTKIKMSPES